MAATRASTRKVVEEEANVPAMQTPPSFGGHGIDAAFVWSQLSDIQKTLGAIEAKLDQQKDATAKMDGEIGKIKTDVSEFKQIRHTAKVLGWIVGVLCAGMLALGGILAKEAWSVLKPTAMQAITPPPSAPK